MSLQVAIMKVLTSYPGGRASIESIKSDIEILAGAGLSWTQYLKRLAAGAPDLDVFGQGLIVRDDGAWQITTAGRELLLALERLAVHPGRVPASKLEVVFVAEQKTRPIRRTANVHRSRRARRRVA